MRKLIGLGMAAGCLALTTPAWAEPPQKAPAPSDTTVSADDVEPSAAWSRSTWGWLTLGTGGALLTLGIVSYHRVWYLKNSDAWQEYLHTTPQSQDPCDRADGDPTAEGAEARDICSEGNAWSIASYVLLPLAAAGIATGITLIATDPGDEEQKKLTVEPTVGPRSGALQLRYTF